MYKMAEEKSSQDSCPLFHSLTLESNLSSPYPIIICASLLRLLHYCLHLGVFSVCYAMSTVDQLQRLELVAAILLELNLSGRQ